MHPLIRHRIAVVAHLDVMVTMDFRPQPLAALEALCRQLHQSQPIQRFVKTSPFQPRSLSVAGRAVHAVPIRQGNRVKR